MAAKQECTTGGMRLWVIVLAGLLAAVATAVVQKWVGGESSSAVSGAVAAAVAASLYSQRGKCEDPSGESDRSDAAG